MIYPLTSVRVVATRGLCGRPCCMVYSAALSATAKNRWDFMMSDEDENSYCISRRVGKQGLQHPAGDQIIGVVIPQGNHSNCKTKGPPSGSQNKYILRIEDNSQES